MRLAITIYPDDFAEADRIIAQLRGVRSLELDGYMGKANYDKNFDKPRSSTPIQTSDMATESEDGTQPEPTTTPRKNVSPGEPAIGKIGSSTKEELLKLLEREVQPTEKYTEHLKLLWKRGEVKYDGVTYYI